ncbi:MAG TPA: glycosyltransferase family 4 protein [Solirubrobacteraceae bacterium]|jgi:glycosyltransferase involved in cell wall biosynthesis|nr:glycosyltransferase family 4 protein [Solirubrobacteraceae bacterium]
MSRPRVALVTERLLLGGTEKGMVNHALAFDRSRVDVHVVTLLGDGPRLEQLQSAGIPSACAHSDPERLAQLLQGSDVVHVFRIGLADALVPEARRRAGVPVMVETNIFGQVDASEDRGQFDAHLFISKMCALRYRQRLGVDARGFRSRHAVGYLPVDAEGLRAQAPNRRAAKAALGLDPDRPVVGRTGRDDDRKWRNLLVDMVEPLLARVPEAQVLFVGATPAKVGRLYRAGVLDRCRLMPLVPEASLALVYRACDVFVNAAEIGEAQGLVLAEALALEVPVVTCSTPWVDNAQIEVVDEGSDGHVADHPVAFAEAVAHLLHPEVNRRYGAAGAAKARRLFDPGALSAQLEGLYRSLLAGDGIPAQWSPSAEEVLEFESEYARRLESRFRPLTAAERREVELERLRERAGWALRAAAHLDRRKASFLYWMLRAKLAELTPGSASPPGPTAGPAAPA